MKRSKKNGSLDVCQSPWCRKRMHGNSCSDCIASKSYSFIPQKAFITTSFIIVRDHISHANSLLTASKNIYQVVLAPPAYVSNKLTIGCSKASPSVKSRETKDKMPTKLHEWLLQSLITWPRSAMKLPIASNCANGLLSSAWLVLDLALTRLCKFPVDMITYMGQT
jgi:hypothetical protein